MLGPRTDYINTDDTFMLIAMIVAMRSKDPNTQVGACLVDKDGRIIGTGYNGFPRDISHDALPWDRCGCNPEDTKYMYVGHAEENAIDNCDRTRIYGSTLYVTLFPCNKCAIRIIQNKIREVVYLSDKYHDTSECVASRKMFDLAKIKVRQFKPNSNAILMRLTDGTSYIFNR
jgi:dCMP deaminase